MGKFFKTATLSDHSDSFLDKNVYQNLDYLNYLAKHKYQVVNAGVKLGVNPIILLKHDWSKFKPELFTPTRNYFYGATGRLGSKQNQTYEEYKQSRKLHQKLEAHHLHTQNLTKDEQTELETIADWYAVNKANASLKGLVFPEFPAWWNYNKAKFAKRLPPDFIDKVDGLLAQDRTILNYLYDKANAIF